MKNGDVACARGRHAFAVSLEEYRPVQGHRESMPSYGGRHAFAEPLLGPTYSALRRESMAPAACDTLYRADDCDHRPRRGAKRG